MTPKEQQLFNLRYDRFMALDKWMSRTSSQEVRDKGYRDYNRLDKEIRELVAEIAKTKNNPE